jgi:hypothetical protein
LGSSSYEGGRLLIPPVMFPPVSAQPLVKDTPTGNLTDGDISISPEEPLPANGTVSISTGGATDTDMEAFPPEGVTVIISSDTVTVTNQAVDIGGDEEQSDDEDEGASGDGGDGGIGGDGGVGGDGGIGGDGGVGGDDE